jgi:malonyl-CoA O-methyltransferase
MPLPPIKQRIRESFDRAAATYDAAAVVQRWVCDRLLAGFDHTQTTPGRLLDAGCGTGYGARLLRRQWPEAHITGVDFAAAMLARARHDTDLCCAANIEELPFASRCFDLWWSSLTVQWCDNDKVFAEAARVLGPAARVAVSTLGPNTFHELRAAFAGVDRHRHTLPFDEAESLSAALARAGFDSVTLRREQHTVYYTDLKTLLRAVKAIGAHNVGAGGRRGMMGRAAWQKLETAYEKQRQAAGLPASYDVILAYAKK